MGFWSKLFGIGVVAGAATAAVKVAKQYEQNKNSEEFEIDVPDAAQSGGVLNDVAKAATDVYTNTAAKVKTAVAGAAEKAGVNTEELSGALTGAGKAIVNAGKAVATKVAADAPGVIDKIKGQAGDAIDYLQDEAGDIVEQVKDTVAGVTENVTEDDEAAAEHAAAADAETIFDSELLQDDFEAPQEPEPPIQEIHF